MRKNKLSLQKVELLTSQEEGLELLASLYKIERNTLDRLVQTIDGYDTHSHDQYKAAAHGLFTIAQHVGMDTSEAYAQITAASLAILITDCGHPTSQVRSINKRLAQMYRKELTESFPHVSAISYLRQELMQEQSPSKVIHALNTKENFDLAFSYHEQTDGFRLPRESDELLFYLLGVYRADGSINRPEKYEFYLSGRQDDFPFYTDILEGLIDHEFNIHTKTDTLKSVKRDTATLTPRIMIQSKNHFLYLQEVVHLWDIDTHSYMPLDIRHLAPEHEHEAAIAYFMGMLASGGNIAKKTSRGNTWHTITCKDKEDDFVSEMRRIATDYIGLKPSYTTRGNEITFSKRNVQRLADHHVPFKITDTQYGLFTNQRHLSKLNYFID